MKGSVIVLLFLLVLCIALPFLFTWVEGMEYSTKQLDAAGYSTQMDPTYDIPTPEEDLKSDFFDTIRTGPYYTNMDGTGPDGKNENDSKYLSGKHVFKPADAVTRTTRTSQDVMDKRVSDNVKTYDDALAATERLAEAEKGKKDLLNGTLDQNLSALDQMLGQFKQGFTGHRGLWGHLDPWREGFTANTAKSRSEKSAAVKKAMAEEQTALTEFNAATKAKTEAADAASAALAKSNQTNLPADVSASNAAAAALTAANTRVEAARTALLSKATALANARTASIEAEDLALENAIVNQRNATATLAAKTTLHATAQATQTSTPNATNATALSSALNEKTTAETALLAAIATTDAARKAASAARVSAGMSPNTRQVNDLSDNIIWDISSNEGLYNVNGALNIGPHISYSELSKIKEDYNLLNEKCKNQMKIDCIADFGTNIGDDLCCGQTGVLQDTRYVCPSTRPKCQSFKCGSKFGQCV